MKPNRRQILTASSAALLASLAPAQAGQFSGKIRKSLKWNMVKPAKPLPLADAFKKLRECGFEGVEPNLGDVADRAEEWIAASRESGLVIDGTVTANTVDLEKGLRLTKQLGGDSTLVVARYPQDRPLLESWKTSQDQIRAAIPLAGELGIKMLVENVWATFLISPMDMARYIDEIGSPWVQVHFDIGNMVRWGVAEHWAQVLGPRSQKLDIKEYDLKKAMSEGMGKGFDVPLGEGSINWPAVRTELARINFQGWAAAEMRGGDWDYLTDVARRMDKVLDLA
ncbi:MAG: sugar phosphate isomerase/epimerase [Verrucomicrobia bacterium]|nr:sugar phosphate isomerase/epimerase [Verrucomicrobiota bacterium]